MPEIKHNFTGGKMNKDVDQRLVPKGEYRDAMNIQVSTSEGSDVGTVQNILGNKHGCISGSVDSITNGSTTVGSVADERTDSLYWFISGGQPQPGPNVTMRDSIWRHSSDGNCRPVFVDNYGVSLTNPYNDTFSSSTLTNITSSVFDELEVGWTVVGIANDGTFSNTATISSVNTSPYIPFDFGVTQTTNTVNVESGVALNPTIDVASGLGVVMGQDLNGNFSQFSVNYVYLFGWSGGNVNQLVGDTIEIPAYSGNTYTINAASTVSLSFYNGSGMQAVKLTLNTNLAIFSNPPLDPNLVGMQLTNGTGYVTQYNGSPITALITSSDQVTTDIANGEIIFDIGDYDVTNATLGDAVTITNYSSGFQNGADYCVQSIDSNNNSITLEDCQTGTIAPQGFQVGGFIYGQPQPIGGVAQFAVSGAIELDQPLNLAAYHQVLYFQGPRTLNFNPNTLITGIDIIDDMLFWTDNETEPKKINIERSVDGTHWSGLQHTRVINPAQGLGIGNQVMAREKHITVIRKSPIKALSLELSDGRDPSLNYAAITLTSDDVQNTSIISSSNPATTTDFSGLQIEETIKISFPYDNNLNNSFNVAWAPGDYLLLREELNATSLPSTPLSTWTIRGKILDVTDNNFDSSNGAVIATIEIVGLKGVPPEPDPGGTLTFVADLEYSDTRIFQDKFPRFSYRYKYSDGEYSTFAPWSEPAFIPTSFSYDPKKGWNTGMRNNLQSVKLKGFNTVTYADVISIDILYKDDSSTNVHLVQTISPIDILTNGQVDRPWFSNEYTINSENIKSVIPSGQLLRAWDGVPKKALAQSISGNRVVYGNYEQNYDLSIGGEVYVPDFNSSLVMWAPITAGSPQKSIKSLRDYKLGVVFTDKYGRETPVLIGENGGFSVKKTESTNYNRLTASLNGVAPGEMAYYKFYIKETSSEYYNVPMDRWYSAEDGNIWLSLPSADRNKIDLDTFLYFKKGDSGDENVIENSTEYKVLDIDNEAPKWIKTKKIRIGSVKHNVASNSCLFGTTIDTTHLAPIVGEISFNLNYDGDTGSGFEGLPFKTSTLAHLENIKEQLYIQFVYGNDYSAQYAIAEITSDFDIGNSTANNYFVSLTKPLDNDINIIFDNPAAVSAIKQDVRVVFSKEVVENTPHFDGRFFVKIENDGKIQSMVSDSTQGINYSTRVSKTVYELGNDTGEDYGLHMHAFVRDFYSTGNPVNYVTKDWCGQVTDGCSSNVAFNSYGPSECINYKGQLDNPNGNNYKSAAARQSFTRDLTPANYMSASGHSNEAGASGVFFINKSNRGWEQRDAVGCDDDTLSWPDNNNMNHLSPACNNFDYYGCSAGGKDPFTGITPGGGGSYINIGFAGIKAPGNEPLFQKFHGGYSDGDGNWHLHNDISSFYGVGTTNSRHNDPITKKFVEGFVAGSKFKWKEDPTETIYTVVDQTKCSYDVRFGRHSDGKCNHANALIGDPSSYSKNWRFRTDKPLVWSPSEDAFFTTGGLHLGDASGSADHTRTVTSYSAAVPSGATLELVDVSGIQVGMAARHANIPLDSNVTSIIGNTVTISSAPTSSITGVDVSFGFIIRVKGGSINGVTIGGGTGSDPKENYLLVDRISTQCSNGNSLRPMYELHPGMALDFCNSDSSDTFWGVGIKGIGEKDSNGHYRIDLGGTYVPLHADGSHFQFQTSAAGDDIILNKALAFKQIPMNGASNFSEANTDYSLANYSMVPPDSNGHMGPIVAVGYTLQFLEEYDTYSDGNVMPQDPFIWETKPKNNEGLDVYHEISDRYAIELNPSTISQAIPLRSRVTSVLDEGEMDIMQPVVYAVGGPGGDEITIQSSITGSLSGVWVGPGQSANGVNPIIPGSTLIITKPNGESFSVIVEEVMDQTAFGAGFISNKFRLQKNLYGSEHTLNWHNCYSFANGVESNRSKDVYNASFMGNGVKVSSVFEEYAKERRSHGLVYSGIYNSTSGINDLNQFSYAEKITKDINPIYGSIQKLHSGWGQGGDLVALCEDRVLKILANKDALFNADGNSNVTSTNNVLGQAIPYSGEYGISKNPESFASEAYRIYFTDKVRGTVMRLSMDGLTPISNHGMKDWFRENLKLGDKLIGSYDDRKDEYNITIKGDTIAKTVTFKEDVKGWVSFKSFIPENAISCANEYYTFKDGNIWKHHDEFVNRNTFYNTSLLFPENFFEPSTLEVVFNEVPGSVKSFKTVNYEGSQAKVTSKDENGVTLMDGEYFNLSDVEGWHVTNVITNLEQGGITEFINKEGKWFGYVIGSDVTINSTTGNVSGNYHTEDSSIQGIGRTAGTTISIIYGCMDPDSFNYDDAVTNDDGSCIDFSHGCVDPDADNFQASANTDDGSCLYYGCTEGPLAVWSQEAAGGSLNYDANANYDDGSCIPAIWGCTISGNFNYNPSADFGSGILSDGTYCGYADCMCIPMIGGCTDPNANNYITLVDEMTDVNYDDGSCEYLGCTDPLAENYDPMFVGSTVDGPNGNYAYLNGTAVDDGSCTYIGGCMDALACNYDNTATQDDGLCYFCADNHAVNYDAVPPFTDYTCLDNCDYCNDVVSVTVESQTTAGAGMNNGTVTIEWPVSTTSSIAYYEVSGSGITPATITPSGNPTETHTITGLGTGTYTIYIITFCTRGTSVLLAGGQLPGGVTGTGPNFGIPVTTTITATPVPGCTDNTGTNTTYGAAGMTPINGQVWGACNYNNLATVDDGSCDYTSCAGCTDPLYVEYDAVFTQPSPSAAIAAGYCTTLIVYGCTDSTALNYDASATVDDGSCVMPIYGCMDATLNNDGTYAASNYAGPGNTLGANGTEQIPAANTPDGNCNPYNCPTIEIGQSLSNTNFKINTFNTPYPNTSYYWLASGTNANINSNGVTMNPWSSLASGGGTVIGVKTNEPTMNYVAPGSTTVDVVFNVITADGNCSITETQTFTIGCTDSAATNATGFNISDNTQCIYAGCTDATACNFNPGASVDDGSCISSGCTDPNASNYDPNAGCDDGSCIIEGCMDATLSRDGNGTYAADNYNANATTPCNDGTGNNSCCTYSGAPLISGAEGFPTGSVPNAYQLIRAEATNAGTAYNYAEVTSINVGVGTTTNTINNPGMEIITFGNWSNGTQNFTDFVQQADWAPYVDINHAYGSGSGDLTITYNTYFYGDVINPSIGDALETTVSNSFVLSAGCKTDTSAMNYNSNLDLHIDGSCIAPNPGCTDTNATASSYDAAFNQDCDGVAGGTNNDCCCYTCDVPTFETTNGLVVNTWNDSINPQYATQITFNFAAVDTASSYTIWMKLGSSYTQLFVNAVPTITNGVATLVYNSPYTTTWFQNNTTYEFAISAFCENADGDSCDSSNTGWIEYPLNANP